MTIAALIAWILTAGGGSFLLATWIRNGGQRSGTSRFPPALIFGHFTLAAFGLVLWIIYVATDTSALAWIAFVLLVVVALLGFTMFLRWLPTYRGQTGGNAGSTAQPSGALAERHFPVAVVAGHGALAVTTVVLVLLAALGVGGS
jgi:hypothetical protein